MTNGFEMSQFNEPIVEERNSLDALKIFIVHACEILGLWKILCENQLQNIVNCLSKVIFLSRISVVNIFRKFKFVRSSDGIYFIM